MFITKHIPNFISILSLISGCLSMTFVLNGEFIWSAYLIMVSAIFDYLDGVAAKLLNAQSSMGKALDSIVDVVSFGLVPSFLLYQVLGISLLESDPNFSLFSATLQQQITMFSAYSITVFAALRLAKFTANEGKFVHFEGLPSTGNAIFIASIVIIIFNDHSFLSKLLAQTNILLLLIGFLSIIMVAPIPMISLKFNNTKWKGNEVRYIMLILGTLGIGIFQITAIPFLMMGYVFLSIIYGLLIKED